jgi:hypothetical protein
MYRGTNVYKIDIDRQASNNFALQRFNKYQQGVNLFKQSPGADDIKIIEPVYLHDKIKRFIRGEIDNKKIELERLIYSITYTHKSVLLSAMVNTACEFLEHNLGDMDLCGDDIEKLQKIINNKKINKNKNKKRKRPERVYKSFNDFIAIELFGELDI